jgi:hypothetical protein
MSAIKVECYAGYKGDQYPQRFTMGSLTLEIKKVEDQWYGPSSQYFRVLAGDGNIYVLRHDLAEDLWSLDAFRTNRG